MKKLFPLIFTFFIGCLTIYFLNHQHTENHEAADQFLNDPTLRYDGPAKFAAVHSLIRTRDGEQFPAYKTGDQLAAFNKAVSDAAHRSGILYEWKERGPANVGGRTRGLIVDPDDATHRTWYVGSAGGGVWRTDDAGGNWELLTQDIPNLSTSTLAMSAANTAVIYAGTGEGFGNIDGIIGSGIWKSTDRGSSWTALTSTSNNQIFANVTRLIINPENENELLASTIGEFINGQRSSYIMKSIDGGDTWIEKYVSLDGRIQQIVYSPNNFDVQYATVNSVGVFKSTDAGDNWEQVFDVSDKNIERIELAISRLDDGVIHMSCEGDQRSILYFTRDTFSTVQTPIFNGRQADWLSGQGWYDNTIEVHPYNDNLVWVAGAGSMLEIEPGTEIDTIKRYDQFTNGTSFLSDIDNSPFSGVSGGSAPDLFQGLPFTTETDIDDLVDVVIYFGPGRSQKAHLFDVEIFSYTFTYNSMVDVPFEAWDTLNNRQVSIAVYDIDQDGKWTYSDYRGQGFPLHDVVTANILSYADTGNIMLQQVNPIFKAQYYFFQQRDTSYQGDETNFPDGYLSFITREDEGLLSEFKPITDGYFQYSDIDPVGSKGVHVDHHNIIFIPLDDTAQTFYVLNANDGGIAFSEDNAATFVQTGATFSDGSTPISLGYNVSQFYGVDKMNGADRYIGGTQDNGTWVSPRDPDETSEWDDAPSGDGFECAWHYTDSNLILETSQFNGLYKSYDGGNNWTNIFVPGGQGPFITRVAASQVDPDLVFMAAEGGVLKSTDFGDSWNVIEMPESWQFNNFGPPTEISLASSNVVWSGGSIRDENRIAVSFDRGETFAETNNYDQAFMGTVTGIASHPNDSATAYALFSQANGPKILKTVNLGQNWTDISGFITNVNESINGYPDVATYALLVMPWDVNWIWAGTEIGLFESRDGGESWQLADNGLPAVSIWEMKIVGDEIVFATHGRGIWTIDVSELNPVGVNTQHNNSITDLIVSPNPVRDEATITYNIEQAEHVTIELINLNGQVTKTIFNEKMPAGKNAMTFQKGNLIDGMYLVVVRAGQGNLTRRIVIQ